MAPPKISPVLPKTISDFITIGHSLAGSYGAKNDEESWPYRVSSALGAECLDRHVDGAAAALDDSTNSGDGGWATAAFWLDPNNVTPPWVAQNPLTSIYLGHNDDVFSGGSVAGRAAMRAALRGAIGHARAAARFNDNDATVRTTGANEIGAGSWVRGTPAAVQYSMNAQFTYTTAVNDEIHIDVPAGQPINAIWIYTMSGGGVNTTLNGAVLANASSVVLTSAASFPTSGTAKVIDTSIAAPNGPEDVFTWTGKSTNTLTGVPTAGANALLAHNSGLTVVNMQNEGALFTVDVDGTPSTPPASNGAFDTRNLGFQVAPARINGHGWRIPIPADGLAHEVTIKVTALQTAFYFDGWEIEATIPPMVVLPLPIKGYWYELYTGYQYVPTDASIDGLRTEIASLAAEFDRYVITIDADAALGKQKRYFYQPTGSTTTGAITANQVTVPVANTANFATAGGLATIVDAGTPDTFSYTGKSVASGAGNLTGVPASGVFAVIAHAGSGLDVAPTDGMHMSDQGHEVFASQFLDQLTRKMPRDTRTSIASQRHRGSYPLRDAWKQPVRVASTVNQPIATPPTVIDGVSLFRGDRILLPVQTNPAENGIYIYLGGSPPLMRAYDASGNDKVLDGLTVSVSEGIVNGDTDWTMVTNNPIAIGTTSLRFTRIAPPLSHYPTKQPWLPTPSVGGGTLIQAKQMNFGQEAPLANLAALSTGRISIQGGFVCPAGQTITNVLFMSGSTALVTGTNQWAGIADISRVVKGVSADRTNEAWGIGVLKQFPLVTPWTPDVDTPFTIFLNVTATTVPSLIGIAKGVATAILAPVSSGTSNTGRTTPVANGSTLTAYTAVVNGLYCGWS